jgi:Holliday junction resolvase-like predicted endonuclease
MRERLINRRQQGDLGEASAIEWLTTQGATVFVPIGYSPDIDLLAETDGTLIRVQVKASVCRFTTPDGHDRWAVSVATRGGNQSWNRTAKLLDPSRIDYLFALVGDGRRWMIPSPEIEAASALSLGGPKYSEFEIQAAPTLEELVYTHRDTPVESSVARSGEYPSGQRTAPVKRLAQPSQVRILSPPCVPADQGNGRTPTGQTRVSGNRQIVIPKRAFEAAGLQRGDRLKAHVTGPGEVFFRSVGRYS